METLKFVNESTGRNRTGKIKTEVNSKVSPAQLSGTSYHIRLSPTVDAFKCNLKTHFFSYFTELMFLFCAIRLLISYM